MKKHAYLIIAHNQFALLKELLKSIDDERNDIYIHIDKKIKNIESIKLKKVCNYSNIYFTERISVSWGSESLIKATMILLQNSTSNTQEYSYYHFISGQDFPLKSQDKIHNFFDEHQGYEFISCRKPSQAEMERIKFYYPFQQIFGGRTIFNKVGKRVSVFFQKVLSIDRTKEAYKVYGIGSQWFSITNRMAEYIVSQEDKIKKYFYKGLCADEMFLQTLWLNAPFYNENMRYHSERRNHPCIQEIFFDVVRAIDFSRGNIESPYVFDEKDYEMLIESNCCFARKMEEQKSKELIKKLSKF